MMYLRRLAFLLLLLPGGARRSVRVDRSHHGAQRKRNMLNNGLEVSAESREALIPGKGLLRRAEQRVPEPWLQSGSRRAKEVVASLRDYGVGPQPLANLAVVAIDSNERPNPAAVMDIHGEVASELAKVDKETKEKFLKVFDAVDDNAREGLLADIMDHGGGGSVQSADGFRHAIRRGDRFRCPRRELLLASACLPALPAHAGEHTSVVSARCQTEEAVNGFYMQGCMDDATRSFEWDSVGKLVIEQGAIGPSATGETLWNSAALLADYMANTLGRSYFSGKRVVEVGCGTALPSIVAAKLGAARVVATDLAPEVLARAKRNAALNRVDVEVRELVWGSSMLDASLATNFDVVLASDVLWILGGWRPLSITFKDLLAPQGKLLLAETGHDSLALPAALANFRSIAEAVGLEFDEPAKLPYTVDGFDSLVVRAHAA